MRTLSLLPAATEIVGALGLMDDLVGVSHECDFPEEANARPRVTHCEIHGQGLDSRAIDAWVSQTLQAGGSLYTLDEDVIRGLRPELILTQRLCDVCAPAYGSVWAFAQTLPGPPRVLNLEPRSLEDMFANIVQVAEAMGRPDRAVPVLRDLRERVRAVERASSGLDRRPAVLLMEWVGPPFCSGHWGPELVELAGGREVLGRAGEDSVRVEWDAVVQADPEVIVLACCGHRAERTLRDVPLLEARPGWRSVRAVRSGRVFACDGSAYFSRPGPRLVDTLEILAEIIHPEVWAGQFSGRGVVKVGCG
jgi:iron complex transport system substrate-binding protein